MNGLPPPRTLEQVGGAVGAAVLLVGLGMLWRWDRRRRRRAARLLAVTNCGFDSLTNVLVPDGQGGSLHVDFLLLTARGVVVIDLREVNGNIFGGDQMNDWTVMHRSQRFTFSNPQTALYDRVAAVRALAHSELPVEGRIVFTASGRFPKGLPRHTLTLESLPAEFPTSDRELLAALIERWLPTWNLIKQSVTPSRIPAPKAAI